EVEVPDASRVRRRARTEDAGVEQDVVWRLVEPALRLVAHAGAFAVTAGRTVGVLDARRVDRVGAAAASDVVEEADAGQSRDAGARMVVLHDGVRAAAQAQTREYPVGPGALALDAAAGGGALLCAKEFGKAGGFGTAPVTSRPGMVVR